MQGGHQSSISLEEVTEVVKQLHSGKAPGADEIHPEMLKVLGVEGVSWWRCLFNIAWESGSVPKEWQTRGCVQTIDITQPLGESVL